MRKLFLMFFGVAVSTTALAVTLPPELQGSYAYSSDAQGCIAKNYSLSIRNDQLEFGTESFCKAVKVVETETGVFDIQAKCSSEDGKSNKKIKFVLKGDLLKEGASSYKKCN